MKTHGMAKPSYHRATGLENLMESLDSSGGTVLDLGPLTSGTTQTFLNSGYKCFVEDIAEVFPALNADQSNFQSLIEDHLMLTNRNQTFDVVLCWDVLNYLTLESIEILFNLLSPNFNEHTRLHMMQYTGANIPATPIHFRLQENFSFEFSYDSGRLIPSPRHTLIKLLKKMGGFSLQHSHINQQGMHQSIKEMVLAFGSHFSQQEYKGQTHVEKVAYFSSENTTISLPILSEVLSRKGQMQEMTLLDLGKKTGRETHFLNRHSGQLFIEDLFSTMAWKKKLADAESERINLHILRAQEPDEIHLVLSWDIFNFCSEEQIRTLGAALSKKMPAGSLLHVIGYAEHQVPKRPAVFSVQENGTLTVSNRLAGESDRPFASTASLMKLLPDFTVSAFHYGNDTGHGFQEYLLSRKPG
ncbi:hypothetical protein [Reinekea marinisedimentorum]|uniref:Methyltransferase family protein n=1 Tax=Reinekea marinisedimentorum TaxID=230495 RepID=A0A4R3IC49_9GAMM|nr:hypothetical protein [Reinekea marinisedimentorum]TCS43725.1 hypothetical protein BCF53_10167 [Reinekea marinisedimentorum]